MEAIIHTNVGRFFLWVIVCQIIIYTLIWKDCISVYPSASETTLQGYFVFVIIYCFTALGGVQSAFLTVRKQNSVLKRCHLNETHADRSVNMNCRRDFFVVQYRKHGLLEIGMDLMRWALKCCHLRCRTRAAHRSSLQPWPFPLEMLLLWGL